MHKTQGKMGYGNSNKFSNPKPTCFYFRFHVYLPFESVQNLPTKLYYLPKPSGFLSLEIIEGRNLLAMDDHFMGSGKSDPYVIVSIGERSFNFRDKFVPKTVNPKWNYTVPKILVNLRTFWLASTERVFHNPSRYPPKFNA